MIILDLKNNGYVIKSDVLHNHKSYFIQTKYMILILKVKEKVMNGNDKISILIDILCYSFISMKT